MRIIDELIGTHFIEPHSPLEQNLQDGLTGFDETVQKALPNLANSIQE